MKIAISAKEDNEDSEISEMGGRAPFYLIFENKKLVEKIKNPFDRGGGGAGFSVAKMLADKNVDLVVTGKVGPNMEMALQQKGIEFKQVSGKTVKEALDETEE
ncbi:NifB/NifX family molybdenum-iron cluster-binding protein [Candidatus Woesearchaeota archaeon]|nr:NifB/NifX family molybdenum-iron cluster-binding protein [Candidatus Woesearchaeota archaeon]